MDKTQLREDFIKNISTSSILNYSNYLVDNKLISNDFFSTNICIDKTNNTFKFELSIFFLLLKKVINDNDKDLDRKYETVRSYLKDKNILDNDISKYFYLKNDQEVIEFLKKLSIIIFDLDDKLSLYNLLK